jgi:hypothetical protein
MDFLLCFGCSEIMLSEPFFSKDDWMIICGRCGVTNKLRKMPDAIRNKFSVIGTIYDIKK